MEQTLQHLQEECLLLFQRFSPHIHHLQSPPPPKPTPPAAGPVGPFRPRSVWSVPSVAGEADRTIDVPAPKGPKILKITSGREEGGRWKERRTRAQRVRRLETKGTLFFEECGADGVRGEGKRTGKHGTESVLA